MVGHTWANGRRPARSAHTSITRALLSPPEETRARGEVLAAFPTTYTGTVSLPHPAQEMVQSVVGAGYAAVGYDTSTALSTIKMDVGIEDMFQTLLNLSGVIAVKPNGARGYAYRFERADGHP